MTPVPSYATSHEVLNQIKFRASNFGIFMPWEQNIFAYRLDDGFIRIQMESDRKIHTINVTEDAFKKLAEIFSNLPADESPTRWPREK